MAKQIFKFLLDYAPVNSQKMNLNMCNSKLIIQILISIQI